MRWFGLKSSFSRSFYTGALILLVSLVMVGVSYQQLVKDYLTDTTFSRLERDAESISHLAASYAAGEDEPDPNLYLNLNVATSLSESDIIVCNPQGRVTLCSDSPFHCKHLNRTVNSDYIQKVIKDGGDKATGIIRGLYDDVRYLVARPITYDNATYGIAIVSSPTASTNAVMKKLTTYYLNTALVVILIATVAVLAQAGTSSRPLCEMAKAANDFGHGNLDARVRVEDSYSEETRDLAIAFNNMASSLQKSEYQRQEFVANVSHELKTPMTTIAGYTDGILDGTIPPEKERKYLQIISDESRRLSRLVRRMLDISQIQSQQDMKKEDFDLCESMRLALLSMEQKITDRGLDVEADIPEDSVMVQGVNDLITQVIYNLLENAAKFAAPGSTLYLGLTETGGDKAGVTVRNTGHTIPAEEIPLLFERFHKSDKSRSEDKDGYGLGLYVVKTILSQHKEKITVTSENGVTSFSFTVQLAHPMRNT